MFARREFAIGCGLFGEGREIVLVLVWRQHACTRRERDAAISAVWRRRNSVRPTPSGTIAGAPHHPLIEGKGQPMGVPSASASPKCACHHQLESGNPQGKIVCYSHGGEVNADMLREIDQARL